MTRHTVEEFRHFKRRFVWLFVKRKVSIFGTGAEHLDQTSAAARCRFIGYPAAAKAPREMVREFSDFAFGNAKNLGDFGKCAPGLEGRKAADYGAMFAAIFLEDELHYVVFEVVREINVNVGQFVQRHPFFVEEATEIKVEANWTNAADAQAITNKAVRRAPSCDPLNAAPPAFLQKIPSDEEVFFIADFADNAEFLHHLWTEMVGARPIAFAESLKHQPPQLIAWRRTVWRCEGRELRFSKGKHEVAPFGNFKCMPQPVGMLLTPARHFSGSAKMQSSTAPFVGMFLPQQRQCADALNDFIFAPVTKSGVASFWTSRHWKFTARFGPVTMP